MKSAAVVALIFRFSSHSFFAVFNSIIFCLCLHSQTSLAQESVQKTNSIPNVAVKKSEARVFLENTEVVNLLEKNFDGAIKVALNNQELLKSMSPTQKEQYFKKIENIKADKRKTIDKQIDKLEIELKGIFSEQELKYLASQSGAPFFKKLNQFFLSDKLKQHLVASYLEVSKLLESPGL